jgi:hypothetical protein
VDALLEKIALDWRDGEYAIPGTSLVDYGPSMDGFSPTYKHVMPGCSQGNNIWIMRQVARLREVQGKDDTATLLRELSAAMAKETIDVMYEKGKGYFNVIFPTNNTDNSTEMSTEKSTEKSMGATATKPQDHAAGEVRSQVTGGTGGVVTAAGGAEGAGGAGGGVEVTSYEMRHAVDFFSIVFGMCGATHTACDFDSYPGMREELAHWYLNESVTSTWIRATSPYCNCSNVKSVTVPTAKAKALRADATAVGVEVAAESSTGTFEPSVGAFEPSYPAFETCKAGRPDHGCNGAYPSWPAFATEALCYVQHNNW